MKKLEQHCLIEKIPIELVIQIERSDEDMKQGEDKINHPSHYQGAIETIDYMKDKLTTDGFEGYLAGNVVKYISRYNKKNGLEDLKKCEWYLKKLIETLEK